MTIYGYGKHLKNEATQNIQQPGWINHRIWLPSLANNTNREHEKIRSDPEKRIINMLGVTVRLPTNNIRKRGYESRKQHTRGGGQGVLYSLPPPIHLSLTSHPQVSHLSSCSINFLLPF